MSRRACVIGSGPNGLAAAIVLTQAGMQVEVFEAEPTPGGAARTLELTRPGFLHDFGSAVHPWAAGSPFFLTLPLSNYGLQWIQPSAPLAHPLDDGTAVVLERDLKDAEAALGSDGPIWRGLMEPFVDGWAELAPEVLRPIHLWPRSPVLMARLGWYAFSSAKALARRFGNPRTRALFAGLAAHSFLSLNEPLTAAFGLLLGVSAHAVGWPIPRGGSQSLTNALYAHLTALGGSVKTSAPVTTLSELPRYDLTLCDVTPQQLLNIAGDRLSPAYRRSLKKYHYGPGVFKLDYALSNPIPWKAKECLRAATLHLGGTFEEIAESEEAMRNGRHAERPFVLLSQPSLFDPTRAPQAKHTLWAYCHVPNGSSVDMSGKIEDQIERFAPGFRDSILARRTFSTGQLQAMDANLVGGDIGGGAMSLRQFLFRPTWRQYSTSAKDIYLCSSSTPPGAGVHGMCGYHAARLALSRMQM